MIPFLIDLHGYCDGGEAEDITVATRNFLEQLKSLGAKFPPDDNWTLATVRHAWLHSRIFWEQDPSDPSRNSQRLEGIQVTEDLLSKTTLGKYEHLNGR